MFVPVSVTVDGDVAASRGFEMMGRQAADMTAPLTAVGESLIESVEAQYMSEGAWGGTAWAPLTPEYAAWKDSHAPGLPILVGVRPIDPGTRQSPKRPGRYRVGGDTRRAVLNPAALHVRPTYAVYEPESAIAGYHQRGTEKMPARPIVVLTPGLLRDWDRIWVRWLNTIGSLVGAR